MIKMITNMKTEKMTPLIKMMTMFIGNDENDDNQGWTIKMITIMKTKIITIIIITTMIKMLTIFISNDKNDDNVYGQQ